MGKIILFGGTSEGRLLAESFAGTGVEVEVCVATEYGATLLPGGKNIHVHAGRMDEPEMEVFLKKAQAQYCLDATHPYAVEVTQNIRAACLGVGLPYIRVLRKKEESAGETKAVFCNSVEDAVSYLAQTTGNILLTTGSRDLEAYTKLENYRERCFARVLPTLSVMEKCKALGFEGKNLIGMQGPFSEELNFAMLKQINASYLVTKNSGKEGGYPEKREAALRAGAHIVVIGRPAEEEENALSLGETIAFVRERFGLSERPMPSERMGLTECFRISGAPDAAAAGAKASARPVRRQLYLIGMGPGNEELLTKQALSCLEGCSLIIGAKRVLEIWPGIRKKQTFSSYKKEEIAAFLRAHPEHEKAAVVYSGDIGFYSGAKGMEKLLEEFEVHPVTGISSPLYFLNRLGLAWEDVRLVSCHGQDCGIVLEISCHRSVCALLGTPDSVSKICEKLQAAGLEDVKITVGERLSYPEEKITKGTPAQLAGQKFDALSVALFENPAPAAQKVCPGIGDEAFIRGKVPMTKEEIRTVSLSKLHLTKDSVVYDVGAGTGSVSIEAAGLCPAGRIYAIEKKEEALQLLLENRKKFGTDNMTIVPGEAPGSLEGLEKPTHVFVGGSSGQLEDIVRSVRKKNEKARFVINAVTLETLANVRKLAEKFPEYEDMEVVQLNVSRSKKLGNYHLMNAENPVFIISFGGES